MALEIGPTVARYLFRAMVPRYVEMGFSANKAIIDFRNYYPSFRRADMLGIFRDVQGAAAGFSWQSRLKPTTVIPRNQMGTFRHTSPAEYRVRMTLELKNIFTGETDRQMVSYYTDERLSKLAYTEIEADMLLGTQYFAGWEVAGVDFHSVQRKAK